MVTISAGHGGIMRLWRRKIRAKDSNSGCLGFHHREWASGKQVGEQRVRLLLLSPSSPTIEAGCLATSQCSCTVYCPRTHTWSTAQTLIDSISVMMTPSAAYTQIGTMSHPGSGSGESTVRQTHTCSVYLQFVRTAWNHELKHPKGCLYTKSTVRQD